VLRFGGHVAFVGFQVAVFGLVALARCAIGTAYQMATDRLGRFRELHLTRPQRNGKLVQLYNRAMRAPTLVSLQRAATMSFCRSWISGPHSIRTCLSKHYGILIEAILSWELSRMGGFSSGSMGRATSSSSATQGDVA
jgi:hypothetical protein